MSRPIPGRDRIPGAPVRPVVVGPSERPVGPAPRPVSILPADDGDPAAAFWAAYRRHGSRSARDRLVEHYRPLVQAVAGRATSRLPSHVDPADLVQAGMFGLFEAIERYDPDQCPRFENYAVSRVRGAVLDELRALDWVPRTVRMRAREVARTREHLTVRLRRAATEREVADALHLAPRELGTSTPLQLLSMELLCEGTGGGSVDPFADHGPDPAAAALDRDTHRQLWHAVAQLGDRDRLVVRLYYLENRTLAEIGRMLGVTESRICQLHSRLVARLRGQLEDLLAAG
jgi:RNA polymerase sigma factor for flagellar operon FliA